VIVDGRSFRPRREDNQMPSQMTAEGDIYDTRCAQILRHCRMSLWLRIGSIQFVHDRRSWHFRPISVSKSEFGTDFFGEGSWSPSRFFSQRVAREQGGAYWEKKDGYDGEA